VLRYRRFAAVGAARAATAAPRQIGDAWTPRGEAPHMHEPSYIAFGPDGKLWVSDTGNHRIVRFERNAAQELVPVTAPAAPTGLNHPVGIAFDPEGNVFVVDSGNNRVRRYDANLVHQADFGTAGAGTDAFDDPRGIAIAQRDEPLLYVADRDNNRVRVVRRDGTAVGEITTDGSIALARPEDVAVDRRGNTYIADTGNARIVQFDATDHFVQAITINAHGQTFHAPCGVSVDPDDALIVTDRDGNSVYRVQADGTLLAYWDLTNLLLQDIPTATIYLPELARLLTLSAPARAVLEPSGLLAIADTGNARVRLVRVHTDLHVNLNFEGLGVGLFEGLPDLSLRVVTKADWRDELGLRVNVGDVSIFDESQDFASEPIDGFADDEYAQQQLIGPTDGTNAAINVLRVVRTVQRWYQHHTRADDAEHRWGTSANARTLNVDLTSSDGSYQFLDVNLGERSPHGRGSDAWDDSVIAHEMSHWVFYKNTSPLPPFSLVGLFALTRPHWLQTISSYNQALSEGWTDYVEPFWGAEFSATDRGRGYKLCPGGELQNIVPRGDETNPLMYVYLFGGSTGAGVPTFDEPGKGLQNEGYVASALYQLHRALTDPEVLFADAPAFWHRFNVNISDEQSRRYSDTIWKAIRLFSPDPPQADTDQASRVYLTNVLRQFRTAQPAFAEMAETILELNNLLVPRITIAEGASAATAGQPLGDSLTMRELETKSFVIKVADATGHALAGYVVQLDGANPTDFGFNPPGPGPRARHGRIPAAGVLHRATDADGVVVVTYQAPVGAVNATLRAVYQPDFDTDAALAPPEPGDDVETVLRKHYLSCLRGAAKTWSGVGNNFGARISAAVRFTIEHRPQTNAGHYSGRVEDRAAASDDSRASSQHVFLAGAAFEVVDRAGTVVASGTLDADGRFDVALPAGQLYELRLADLTGLRG
jgi:sugar lactone lactonase YvrE